MRDYEFTVASSAPLGKGEVTGENKVHHITAPQMPRSGVGL
jgi:hypothetical protein